MLFKKGLTHQVQSPLTKSLRLWPEVKQGFSAPEPLVIFHYSNVCTTSEKNLEHKGNN